MAEATVDMSLGLNISEFLDEDIGFGDITTDTLIGSVLVDARIVNREPAVVAGLDEAVEIFSQLGAQPRTEVDDGDAIAPETEVLRVEGDAAAILTGERLALNFIGRMSGIATVTREVLERARKVNPAVKIAATRKTTPGFRYYEKKAVILGGGDPHRYRLDDAVLIKDNHLKIVGSIPEALKRARRVSFTRKIEVEVETLDDAKLAAEHGADIIMLDNMKPWEVAEGCKVVRSVDRRIIVEVSGGMTPENIHEYAEFPDIISLGWLTHSARNRDFSMEIVKVFK